MKSDFQHSPAAVRGFRMYARMAGALVALIGLVAFATWFLRVSILPDWGILPIRPMAALAFVFAGMAMAGAGADSAIGRRIATTCNVVVVLLGADALVAHLFVRLPSLARWLDASQDGSRSTVMMAELAAVAFLLLGGQGLLATHRRALLLRELCGVGVLAVALASMASFAFMLAQHGPPLLDHLPVGTGITLLLAALGWMSSTPTTGLTRIATAATLGGLFARSLLLPSLLLPVGYAFVFKTLEARFGVSHVTASTLAALCTGGTVASMIWMVAALLDRSERQREVAIRLRNEADTDPLTGLGNRRRLDAELDERLWRCRRGPEPFTVLLLDVDHFKTHNDAFGHPAGDAVLRELGTLLREALRPRDTAIRYGGEEFAVLLHGVDARQAPALAQRILHAIRHHAWPHRRVTVSIGAAQARATDTREALLKRADMALYRAKSHGRDRCELHADDAGDHPRPAARRPGARAP